MKMHRYPAFATALAFITITFTACSKNKSDENTNPVTTPGAYAPYTAGSSFTYQDVTTSNDSSTYTVAVTGDTTIGGQTYKVLAFSNGTHTYNRTDGQGNYYQVVSNLSYDEYSFGSFTSLYLKDNVSANATWLDTVSVQVSGITQQAQLTYQLVQKNITKTVGGVTYQGVSAVQTTGKLLNSIIPLSLTINTNFYASKVGLIETDSQSDTLRLIQYTIK